MADAAVATHVIPEDITLGARYVTDALRKDLTKTEGKVETVGRVVEKHDDMLHDQGKTLQTIKRIGIGILAGLWSLFIASLPIAVEIVRHLRL